MLAILLAILSGIFLSTSYIPFLPWALFFCLTPLWYIWISGASFLSKKKIFFYGWLAQFVINFIGYHWIGHTAIEFGNLPASAGFVILVLFCATQNLHIPLVGVIWFYIHRKISLSLQSSLIFLAVTTAILGKLFPKVFYWNLGYSLFWADWPMYQWADTIGFEGLSAFILLMNGYILWIFILIKNSISGKNQDSESSKILQTTSQYFIAILRNQKKAIIHVVVLIILFSFLNVTGKIKERSWTSTDRTFNVGAVQANIGSIREYPSSYIYNKYFDLTENLLNRLDLDVEDIDLVIWPETAFPLRLGVYPENEDILKSFILSNNISLLTGAFSGEKGGQYYNGLFLFDKKGNLLGKYKKSILLSFGEYLPMPFAYFKDSGIFSEVSDFSAGLGPMVLRWEDKDIILGVQICYEGLYPYFSIELAKQGAQIIANVTNDSWYRNTYTLIKKTYEFFTNEPYIFQNYQHLYMTFARAIEVRRPMIRVTNTGITAAILADGTFLEPQSPPGQEWAEKFEISYVDQPSLTLFTRFGKYIPLLQIILVILIIALGIYQKKKKSLEQ